MHFSFTAKQTFEIFSLVSIIICSLHLHYRRARLLGKVYRSVTRHLSHNQNDQGELSEYIFAGKDFHLYFTPQRTPGDHGQLVVSSAGEFPSSYRVVFRAQFKRGFPIRLGLGKAGRLQELDSREAAAVEQIARAGAYYAHTRRLVSEGRAQRYRGAARN